VILWLLQAAFAEPLVLTAAEVERNEGVLYASGDVTVQFPAGRLETEALRFEDGQIYVEHGGTWLSESGDLAFKVAHVSIQPLQLEISKGDFQQSDGHYRLVAEVLRLSEGILEAESVALQICGCGQATAGVEARRIEIETDVAMIEGGWFQFCGLPVLPVPRKLQLEPRTTAVGLPEISRLKEGIAISLPLRHDIGTGGVEIAPEWRYGRSIGGSARADLGLLSFPADVALHGVWDLLQQRGRGVARSDWAGRYPQGAVALDLEWLSDAGYQQDYSQDTFDREKLYAESRLWGQWNGLRLESSHYSGAMGLHQRPIGLVYTDRWSHGPLLVGGLGRVDLIDEQIRFGLVPRVDGGWRRDRWSSSFSALFPMQYGDFAIAPTAVGRIQLPFWADLGGWRSTMDIGAAARYEDGEALLGPSLTSDLWSSGRMSALVRAEAFQWPIREWNAAVKLILGSAQVEIRTTEQGHQVDIWGQSSRVGGAAQLHIDDNVAQIHEAVWYSMPRSGIRLSLSSLVNVRDPQLEQAGIFVLRHRDCSCLKASVGTVWNAENGVQLQGELRR
jgi:hypothetical protein